MLSIEKSHSKRNEKNVKEDVSGTHEILVSLLSVK